MAGDCAHEVVIVGGGIAGSALATVLARKGVEVAVLERDIEPVDRVRGEFMAPWGVMELQRLDLLEVLEPGGVFPRQSIPYDEIWPSEEAVAHRLCFRDVVREVAGPLCMSHPAMCRALQAASTQAGATCLRGVENIEVRAGTPPSVAFEHDGRRVEWRPRVVVGADGRNSRVRQQLGIKLTADQPHNLLGGVLIDGVPDWPQDTQVIGTEDRTHFLIFPQGGDRLRLYLCYDFADRATYSGPDRQRKLVDTLANLRCIPEAKKLADGRPIGPFNSFSNEDHWTEQPTAPGVILVGDAAGYNDPITGQGLSIALRDVRLVSELVLGATRGCDFRPYMAERRERMRRLRIVARFAAQLRAEFGEEPRRRRERVMKRIRIDKMPSPTGATLLGPERIPALNFEQSTLDALLAP